MNFLDKIKALVSSGEVKDGSKNLVEDIIAALLGDPIAAGKVMLTITKSPFFIREQLFWIKLSAFLNGVYLSDDDRGKLCAKITENGAKNDNPLRLVESIDRAETQQKIQYLVNATRCLLTDFIDLSTYFRICHAITHTLDEDLQFLKVHIGERDISYDVCVQGLLTSGLMYQSVIDENGDQKYSFTPIAEDVDRFAVSYDDIERYPNPQISVQKTTPQISIPSLEWQEFSKDEINAGGADKKLDSCTS